jgi:hypothetical protein
MNNPSHPSNSGPYLGIERRPKFCTLCIGFGDRNVTQCKSASRLTLGQRQWILFLLLKEAVRQLLLLHPLSLAA